MKKFMTALAALLIMTVSAKAMSYEQARQQALFLTDKMAYELNMTDDQYEAAYEINLDYLMGVNTYDDLYGAYWTRRNLDLSYILFEWQYRAFCDAAYFYRPLYWSAGYWHFGIYARYPHRDYFFFDRPRVYVGYRGGHSWGHNGGRSWYKGREFGRSEGGKHFGMRDGFDRGDYGRGRSASMNNRNGIQQRNTNMNGNRNGSFGNRNTTVNNRNNNQTTIQRRGQISTQQRTPSLERNTTVQGRGSFNSNNSSTRTTVTRPSVTRKSTETTRRSLDNSSSRSTITTPRSTFSPSRQSSSSIGGSRSSSFSRSSSPSMSHSSSPSMNRSSSSGSHGGSGSHSGGGSFGGRR